MNNSFICKLQDGEAFKIASLAFDGSIQFKYLPYKNLNKIEIRVKPSDCKTIFEERIIVIDDSLNVYLKTCSDIITILPNSMKVHKYLIQLQNQHKTII